MSNDRLYIPEFYSEDIIADVDFKRASFYFTHWGNVDPKGSDSMLDKLIKFEEWYHKQIRLINGNVHDRYEEVDDFYSQWRWEICYFNCLFAGFAELFAPKKEVA